MFKTIKSNIIFLTVSILLVLSLILSFFTGINFKNDKELMMRGADFAINNFAERVNKEIATLENNAIDLALIGETYYKADGTSETAQFAIKRIFQRYHRSLGGGIWFKPYIINPHQKRHCTYAYRQENGNVVIDENFESEHYDYLNQNWYKEIISNLSDKNIVAWSNPYYENQGSYTLMTTVGAGIYDNDKLIGISTVDWKISSIIKTVSAMKHTKNSFALFADKTNDYVIVSTDPFEKNKNFLGSSLKTIPWYSDSRKNMESFVYHGIKYISYVKTLDNGMILIVNLPETELLSKIINRMTIMLMLLISSSILIAVALYIVLILYINKPIEQLTNIATKIGQGNLDIEIKIDTPKEFADLASTFNKMTYDIKNYINNLNKVTKEKEKIESELSIARTIQYSVLPHTFYPNMDEFEIFATMDTAKEVGGDFYDFFFINPTHFMFLIADVSGKGIPAALFMMTTKTLIKNLASKDYSPTELIEIINNQICENNDQGFFVTLFAGIIDITNGKMTYINCGHNPPLVRRHNENYEYLKIKSNLVLGAMNNIHYEIAQTIFEDGDTIFLYTDGITEALNSKEELYGEERLINCLNSCNKTKSEDILKCVKQNVQEYIGNTEQSDDMTMLAFKYKNINTDIDTFVTLARTENFNNCLEWIEKTCDKLQVPIQIIPKINLITEEIFVNIASYAYADANGTIKMTLCKLADNKVILKFIDNGVPYNPLENKTPDITLKAEERPIGGLGIYMVRQIAERVDYEYINEKNILTITIC